MKDFELVSHTADLEIKVYGSNEKDLFKNALIGMFQSVKPISDQCKEEKNRLICTNLDQVRKIELESTDLELLLIDFLSEALYLSDTFNEAYFDVDFIELSKIRLKAMLKGVKISGFEVVEIKAVTYHKLKIERDKKGYLTANVVFDI